MARKAKTEIMKTGGLPPARGRHEDNAMRITVDFGGANFRRYGKPWIARVVGWSQASCPEIEWGAFVGSVADGGRCEIEAEAGDIIRYGQKDHRGSKEMNEWAVVEADGSLRPTDPVEARELWVSREAEPATGALAAVSDHDLIAECRRRGLSL